MSRPLRTEFPGAIWHVTSRGNEKREIFRDDEDRERFLSVLARTVEMCGWRLHAYVLMGNHYHLVVETPEPNLSRGMRQLNGIYTQGFNRRHGRTGHLMQGRYKAILVERETHLLALLRYVVRNPVRAGLVRRAGAWRWSSFRAAAGEAERPAWLETSWTLEQFGREAARARRRYREFVESGDDGAYRPWESLTGQIYLGGDDFARQASRRTGSDAGGRGVPRRQREPVPTTSDDVTARIERETGKTLEEMRQQPRRHLAARSQLAAALRRDALATLREIGEILGVREAQASALAIRGEERTRGAGSSRGERKGRAGRNSRT